MHLSAASRREAEGSAASSGNALPCRRQPAEPTVRESRVQGRQYHPQRVTSADSQMSANCAGRLSSGVGAVWVGLVP